MKRNKITIEQMTTKEVFEKLDEFRNRVNGLKDRYDEWTAQPGSTPDKRLYAKCYWTVIKCRIEEKGTKQTILSKEVLGKPENYTSKLIDRNTFPSADIIETFKKGLGDNTLEGRSILDDVMKIKEEKRVEAYVAYLLDERPREKESKLRETLDLLYEVSDGDLKYAHDVAVLLTNSEFQSERNTVIKAVGEALERINSLRDWTDGRSRWPFVSVEPHS